MVLLGQWVTDDWQLVWVELPFSFVIAGVFQLVGVGIIQARMVSLIATVVVVLHRLDDVAPGFTHALLVRDGRILNAGPIAEVLTDAGLSECFGTSLRVMRSGERWSVGAT